MRFVSALFVSLFLLFLTGGAVCHAADVPLEKVTIAQFGQERFLLYLPLYVAMEKGLFQNRGLDVSLKFAGNDDQIFAAVMGGSAQFGMGDPVFTAISHDKGGPGKVVALMLTSLGLSGVTNSEKVPVIKKTADLDGLRVSSFAEPSTTYTILKEIQRKDAPRLIIKQAPFGGQIALLEAGQVDIATDIEPSISVAESKGYRVVFDLGPFSDPQAITGITTTENFIADHPDTVQKLVDGLQDAMTLLQTDPRVGYDVAHKIYPALSDKVIHAAVDRMLKEKMYPRSLDVTDSLWQRTLKTRLESGELAHPQATDVAVDDRFAKKAAERTNLSRP